MAIQQFRDAVFQSLTKRAAALMDLLDALTGARHVNSPVALSEEPPFRRAFSSVYDALENGEIDAPALAKVLGEQQPCDSEIIAGREIYAIDATPQPRIEAATLPDRSWLKVVVADSLYGNHGFLSVFLLVKSVAGLVRLRQNQNL